MRDEERIIRDTLEIKGESDGVNYSVQAGAGAGKSTMLSTRICEQIVSGTPIEEFAVITYTNAAADELREKIIEKLQKRLLTDEANKERIETALNSIEAMQISTIHSFLYRILRENSFESGLVMDAKMIESDEEDPRLDEFFNNWYKEHYQEVHDSKYVWEHISKEGKATDKTREVFRNLFRAIANIREEIVVDLTDHSSVIEKAAKDYNEKFFDLVEDFCNEVNSHHPTRYVKKDNAYKPCDPKGETKTICAALASAQSVTGEVDRAVALSEFFSPAKKLEGSTIYSYLKLEDTPPEVVSKFNKIIAALTGDSLEDNFGEFYKLAKNADKVSLSVNLLLDAQKKFQDYIDTDAQYISNDQILVRAYKLLSSSQEKNKTILASVRKKYSKVYVDEFQDTTSLQTGIIKLLCQGEGENVDDDLFINTIPSEKLLIVGDPKQSIYRFTGAEKIVFDNLHALMDGKGKTKSVILRENFRSNNMIVDWVNNTFNGMINGYEEMTTEWNVNNPDALHGVYRLEKGKNYDDKSELVNLIKKLVSDTSPYFIEEYNRDSGEYTVRPIIYSDIMVITRTTSHMEDYLRQLAINDIPVNIQGKIQIDKEIIIKNYLSILKYLSCSKNKAYEIEAIQVLKDEVVANKSEKYIKDACQELQDIYSATENMSASEVAQYVLSNESYYVPKHRDILVETLRLAKIRIHQMVESCLEKNSGNLAHLVELMENYITSDISREIPLESDENAIRLMNVHKSKGLTAGIVIIANNSFDDSPRYGGYKQEGKYYPSASYQNYKSSPTIMPSYGWDKDHIRKAAAGENEEKTRLEYVAATRAAHALIIFPTIGKAGGKAWFNEDKFDLDSVPSITDWLVDKNGKFTSTGNSVVSSSGLNIDKLVDNKKKATNSTEAQFFQVTPSSLEKKMKCGYDSGEKESEDDSPDSSEDDGITIDTSVQIGDKDAGYSPESRPKGNIFGLILHKVYELIFNSRDKITSANKDEVIARIIRQAILEQQEMLKTEEAAKRIEEYLSGIFGKYYSSVIEPIIQEAEAGEIYTELPFSFWGSDDDRDAIIKIITDNGIKTNVPVDKLPPKVWINGTADLVVKKKDGTYKIYDYKSDSMDGRPVNDFRARMAEKYKGQLELYKIAIRKAFKLPADCEIETELIDLYK